MLIVNICLQVLIQKRKEKNHLRVVKDESITRNNGMKYRIEVWIIEKKYSRLLYLLNMSSPDHLEY